MDGHIIGIKKEVSFFFFFPFTISSEMVFVPALADVYSMRRILYA